MKKLFQKTRTFFMGLALLGFLAGIFAFCVGDSLALEITSGKDAGCLLMPSAHHKICENALAEHLSLWQAMFTALPQEKSFFGLLIVIFSLALTLIFRKKFMLFFETIASVSRLLLKQYHQFTIFNSLRVLFSQGILNSKVYSFVTI